MRPGVVELLASTAVLAVICTSVVVWAQFQPKPAPPPVAAAAVPPPVKPEIGLIAAAAADAKVGVKAPAKSKKAKKPNRSIAQVPKVATP